MTTATANGKPHKSATPADVRRSLQEQLSTALIAGKHRRARTIAESLLFFDEFGGSDIWDAVRPSSNDGPGATRWVPLGQPSDRRHGADWPVWRTETELFEWLNQARLRLASNAYAQGLLRNRTNNVVGKGYAYTAVPVKPKAKSPGEGGKGDGKGKDALAEQVQEVIDEFLRLNNFNGGTHASSSGVIVSTREREIFRRVDGDGECFVRLHFQDDGTTRMRFVEPAQVRSFGDLPQEGWSYGIQHQMDPYEDVEVALAYKFFWPDASAPGGDGGLSNVENYEEVDAREVLHLKGPDTPSTVKRGLSRYLFDTGRALDRASRLQRNASLGAAYRAATGEIWQHQAGTQAQITSLASGLGETGSPTGDGGLETVERIRAPAIRRIPASQELVPLPPDQSESYLAAGQGDLQQAGAGFAAPAYWFGDTGEVNYNNAESAAAPAVRDGQCEQEYYKQAFCAVIWRAITWAVECGKLPEGVEDRVKLEVEAPAVLHRNELEKAQEDQIGVSVGWKDPQTCAEERGLDWDTIKARREEYQADQLEQQVAQQEALGLPDEGAGPPKPGQPGPKDGEVKARVVTPPGGGKGKPEKPPENLEIKPRVATPGGGGGQKARPFGESFDPSEKRDDSGQWTAGGGGGGGGGGGSAGRARTPPKSDPVHDYLPAFNEPGDAPATGKEAREANGELRDAGSRWRIVPKEEGGGWEARHVSELRQNVAEDWVVFDNPLTGKPDMSDKAFAKLTHRMAGDEHSRGYLPGFNSGEPATQAEADQANEELEADGSRFRLAYSKDYQLWVATPVSRSGGAKVAEGYDPGEKRDDSGKWTAGGGGGAGKKAGDKKPAANAPDAGRVEKKLRTAERLRDEAKGHADQMRGWIKELQGDLPRGTPPELNDLLAKVHEHAGTGNYRKAYAVAGEAYRRAHAAVQAGEMPAELPARGEFGYSRRITGQIMSIEGGLVKAKEAEAKVQRLLISAYRERQALRKTGAKVREGFDPSEKRDDSGQWTAGGGGGGTVEATPDNIRDLISQYDNTFEYYGLRQLHSGEGDALDAEPGDVLDPSYVWEDDRKTDERLDGTSVIGFYPDDEETIAHAIETLKGYSLGTWVVVGSNDARGQGQDKGEVILKDPEVLGVLKDPRAK